MRRAGFGLVLLIAGCGGPAEPTPEPMPPPRPDAPLSWRMITSDEGDVHLVVPPDLVVLHTEGSVLAMREGDDAVALTFAAIPPRQLNQPRGGESVVDWADAGGWLTAAQGHIGDGEVRRRDLLLPAGPAIELTSSWPLGDESAWTILYVIRTSGGYGLLQVSGHGPSPLQPSEEVRLMRELVKFEG